MRGPSGRFCAVSGAARGIDRAAVVLTVPFSLRETSRHLVVQEASDGAPSTPVPYTGPLEDAWLPSANDIVAEARKLVAY